MVANLIRFDDRQCLSEETANAIIFYHIPKCGGSTLRKILEKHYTSFDFSTNLPQNITEINTNAKGVFTICGHTVWGLHEHLNSNINARYITLLRDPLDRCISSYHFGKHKLKHNYTCEEYIDRYLHNFFVKTLGSGSLQLAKKRLVDSFYLFGVLELFQEFLALLCDKLLIEENEYSIENISESSKLKIDQQIIDNFKKKNRLDYDFYKWAKGVFQERISNLVVKKTQSLPPCPKENTMERCSSKMLEYKNDNNLSDLLIELEKKSDDYYTTFLKLSIYKKKGQKEKLIGVLLKHYKKHSFIDNDFLGFFEELPPKLSIPILANELSAFSIFKDTYLPSITNTIKQNICFLLAEIYDSLNNKKLADLYYQKAYQIDKNCVESRLRYCNHLRKRKWKYKQ